MAEFKDYYQILQVHHLAEPEIIEGAYKKLVKKYHPDLNPATDTAAMMREINIAYDVLRDPVKRREYHLLWQQKTASQTGRRTPQDGVKPQDAGVKPQAPAAQFVLNQYFREIAARNFTKAYDYLSERDKKMISPEDFSNWQNEVAKVFLLQKFHSEVSRIRHNVTLRGCLYREIVEFRVETGELNIVMDRVENDEFMKQAVLESDVWKVFLGYDGLEPFIHKFQKLAKLISAKSMLNELQEARGKTDPATALLNQRGFTERIENELLRFQRYGNVFSLIFIDVELPGNSLGGNKEGYLKDFSAVLAANLRQLDTIGRWEDMKLAVLLPETGLAAAVRVAVKIRKIVKLCQWGEVRNWRPTACLGVVECGSGNLVEIIRWAEFYLQVAKRNGSNIIASAAGIV